MNPILIFLALTALLFPVQCHAFKCSATTTPILFTNYDVFSTLPLDTTASLTVSCTNPEGKPMQVNVSISSGNSGSFNPRQMAYAGAGLPLSYYLFLDPSRTTIWGDGTGGTGTISGAMFRTSPLNAVIYGRAPARQNLKAGSYSDSLVVTVTW